MRDGRRVVKHGITDDIDRRFNEMVAQGLRFTSMCSDRYPITKETALRREAERVQTYRDNHDGRRPRYNRRP